MNILVIGSGLSAIGAIKKLVELGYKPVVLDVGKELEKDRQSALNKLVLKDVKKWTFQDRNNLSINDTVSSSSKIPKKLVFGSDFFYGKSIDNAKIENVGTIPPFSYAKGGLSAGWGGAVLPPSKFDMDDWPISSEELNKYCQIVLKKLPYSSEDDGLSLSFPTIKTQSRIKLSTRASILLKMLNDKVKLKKDDTLFGQARLLVNADKETGCRYCGECMSGCIYKSIYKSDDEISNLIDENKIIYIRDSLVDKVIEQDGKVEVQYYLDGNIKKELFEKVFLAAGAVNSSRIILNSLNKYNHTLKVKTRGGFVIPVFSFKALPLDWPNVNTQPSLFLEFRGKGIKHWVHTQIASDNELLLKMLGLKGSTKNGIIVKMKRFIAQHTYLLLVNYHSNHSGYYEIKLKNSKVLETKHITSFPQFKTLFFSWVKLFQILLKIGSIPLYIFAKLNSGSYHVGGTIPMKNKPKDLETDILGRVKGFKNVHVVDTSTFPSLPGTTIGLVMMANAYRIVEKSLNNKV